MRAARQVGEGAQSSEHSVESTVQTADRQLVPVRRTAKVLKVRGHSEGLQLLQYVQNCL